MAGAQQQHITVLLIEDEALIRMCTAAMLEDAGYRVLEAENADMALEILAADPHIALVITDVQMPGRLDGLGLCRIIDRDFPQIRTLVTSGRSSLQEARDCGAGTFLPKPYSAAAMQRSVQAVLV